MSMDESTAAAVLPTQLVVLTGEVGGGVELSVEIHRPDKRGDTITVLVNDKPWRSFRTPSEAQTFLAGAVSGARLCREQRSDA